MPKLILPGGHSCLFDEEDRELIEYYEWVAAPLWPDSRSSTMLYALGEPCGQLMHRLVMGAAPGQKVDHANCNGLDNRKDNLRFATPAQNSANSRKAEGCSSRFKGVTRLRNGNWMAQIRNNGQNTCLGVFQREEDAARAYNVAAARLFGEFARGNSIPDGGAVEAVLANVGLTQEELLVLRLQVEQGWPVAKIATKLGATISRVRAALDRARRKGELYQPHVPDEEDDLPFAPVCSNWLSMQSK